MSYLNPTQNTYKPKQGHGIIKVEIFVKTILAGDISIERYLAYEYKETVNDLEVFIEKPSIKGASDLNYDIRQAVEKELKYKVSKDQMDNLIINYLN